MTKIHYLLMAVCGLMVIGALAAVFFFDAPVSTVFLIGMLVVCPLMHFVMMRFMSHGHNEGNCQHQPVESQKKLD